MLRWGRPWWGAMWRWLSWRSWFGRRKGKHLSGANRRQAVRFDISVETSCRLLATVEADPRPVQVRNISVGGISLVLQREVAADALLNIELLNRPQMFLCKLQVR